MIAQAIQSLRPNAQWVLKDDTLEWLDEIQSKPTEEEIQIEITRLEIEYKVNQYSRDRIKEYSKLNQFEMQYNDSLNGTTTWIDAINAIKVKYPKGA